MNVPCNVTACDNPAIHIVHMKVEYFEKRDDPIAGSRWHKTHDNINIYVCRNHRNRWLQKGTRLVKEGGLI